MPLLLLEEDLIDPPRGGLEDLEEGVCPDDPVHGNTGVTSADYTSTAPVRRAAGISMGIFLFFIFRKAGVPPNILTGLSNVREKSKTRR
jgi:hypothetical protein